MIHCQLSIFHWWSVAAMRRFMLVMTVVCSALAGCGKGQPNLAEVEGTLKFRGKPMAEVMVWFCPDPPKESVKGLVFPDSVGWTDEKGHYRLTCERPAAPGAMVGTHHVRIIEVSRLTKMPGNKPLLDEKYMMATKTPLTAEVRAGGP